MGGPLVGVPLVLVLKGGGAGAARCRRRIVGRGVAGQGLRARWQGVEAAGWRGGSATEDDTVRAVPRDMCAAALNDGGCAALYEIRNLQVRTNIIINIC
jgi:hypothetical protein